jgi:acyl-coenzyme A thioesterase PaaI-like protein
MSKVGNLVSKLIFGNATLFRRYMNVYRPFLGAGIRVTRVSKDFREADVQLRRVPGNGNAFGTHFGGSLYAMTDPIYVLMFVGILGDGYLIWDKSAKIDFIKPGRGTVTAKFRLSETDVLAAREATASGAKYLPVFTVEVVDASGTIVARVEKELYIRRKPVRGAAAKTH